MLKIHFGSLQTEVKNIDNVFAVESRPEWLDDPFIAEMLWKVDGIRRVQSTNLWYNPVIGTSSTLNLSKSMKNLMLAYKTDRTIDASCCGDICAEWLLKIAEKKDLHITLCHLMDFSKKDPKTPFQCYITNNHKQIDDIATYAKEGAKLILKQGRQS